MRILLTGTSGQVGGALRPLLENSSELVTPGKSEFDLARPDDLTDALDRIRPDIVVNPAAYTAVDQAEDEPELAFRINAEAPAVIARWAARHDVPLIHFSTDYVYDGSGSLPRGEDDACAPLSVYGKSKLAGDVAIAEAGGSHLIIRTGWVFAARGRNFLRTIIRLARERDELRIVSDQVGSPTTAHTIAEAVANMLSHDRNEMRTRFGQAHGLVHLTNSQFTSWHGFANAIVEGLRGRGVALKVRDIIAINTRDFPTKAARPSNSRLDLSRLRQVFGITTTSWEQALDRELDIVVKEVGVA